jgi:hypothetical protein
MDILFPVLAIKRGNTLRPYRFPVKAIRVDADSIRMGARDVPGLDTTMSTEVVLCNASVERVGLNVIFTTE